ncbi:MAG: hypothetical protein A2Y91_00560 [Chloroflexi bacterium RBG_13_54_8]|nr:MAG: hypothetical protein A2Y91_00560 [Chloroflexi bacterium RBG_13_54_8]
MEVFDLIFLKPILNFLILLSNILFHNFGLAIIMLTILVRLVILPLTLKQLRSSKKMSEAMKELQPKLQQLKKKYAKDPRKMQQEQMTLYKEAGISPLGCLSSPMFVSTLIQLPIFIALYRAIIQALAVTPQDFLGLSQSLYSWPMVREALPVSGSFLWLNLGSPDPYFLIPILVMATMWISQKMISQPAADPQQQSMQNMMQIMMPLMFGFITFTLPAGLGLYFVVTSVFSIVVQYFVYGWGNLGGLRNPFARSSPSPMPSSKLAAPVRAPKHDKTKADITVEKTSGPEKGARYGKSRDKRSDSGGSH